MLLGCENTEGKMNLKIDADQTNFGPHINETCKRVSKQLLNRLKNLIPPGAKLQLFKCAIIPHLTYCYLVWHFS